MKLGIGSAQFGELYGISNSGKPLSYDGVKKILTTARRHKIKILDTAASYGESEKWLGEFGLSDFDVVTKVPAMKDHRCCAGDWIKDSLKNSLKRLQIPSIYGLLLHCPQMINHRNANVIRTTIKKLKEKGKLKKFGVSIYNPQILKTIVPMIKPDLVQAPFNILDRSLSTSGWMEQLYQDNIEIHVRSVFLQGLLLLPEPDLPKQFTTWRPLFSRWHQWLGDQKADPVKACLAAVNDPRISCVLVGVQSEEHLSKILLAFQDLQDASFPSLGCEDRNLIDPTNWRKE